MAYLASFNGTLDPAPVTGWWDTGMHTYDPPPPEPTIELTQEQWDARLTGFWQVAGGSTLEAAAGPAPPPQTPDQVYSARIAQGVTVTSSDADLDGKSFGLDDITVQQFQAVAVDYNGGLGLPGDLPTFSYPVLDGSSFAEFSGPQVVQLYKGMRNLILHMQQQLAVLRHGGTPAWPAQTVTITAA